MMNKNINKKISIIVSIASVIMSGFIAKGAVAETLVISGNGADSSNEVSATTSQNTSVSQDNNAQVTNDVNTASNTGNNSTSDNTGGNNTIQTGDVNTQVVTSSTVNQNVATSGCCPTGVVNGSISGNGSGSTSGLNINNTTNTTINSTNNAYITNIINGYANTGNNTASGNNGNVRITTGNINVLEKVTNNFNVNNVEAGNGGYGDVDLIIKGNGSDSENYINYENNNDLNIITTNIASIVNESDWDLNTGNNVADDNIGTVDLKTGDIVFKSVITNTGNVNNVDVTCCRDKETVNPPATTPPSTTKTEDKPNENGKGGNGGGSSKGGDTLGTAIGNVLPATGLNLFLMALIGNIAMLFLGMYLRLRSGRSPSVTLAI